MNEREPEATPNLIPNESEPVVLVDEAAMEAELLQPAAPAAPQHSWLDWLRPRPVNERLAELNQTIADHPNAAINYVLRGELYLNKGEIALAQADFRWAFTLADADFEASNWGLVAQVVRDRALDGLREAERRLR
jgi:hypothetical protein